jgi:hypothetical protein
VRVFAVWFRMYPGDAEERWPRALFTDPRVQQAWDEPKMAGRWFLDNLRDLRPAHRVSGKFPQRVDAMWDTWMLFDRQAKWKDKPDGLLSWGYPIMATRGQLRQDLGEIAGTRR